MITIKITIDTKEDSKEEIRKAIRLLSSLVESEVKVNTDIFSSGVKEEASNSFANMFGDSSTSKEKKEPEEGTPIDFSGFMDLVNNSDKEDETGTKKEIPEIVSY